MQGIMWTSAWLFLWNLFKYYDFLFLIFLYVQMNLAPKADKLKTVGWGIVSLQNKLSRDDNTKHQCGVLWEVFLINGQVAITFSSGFMIPAFSGWKHVYYTVECIIICVTSVLATCFYRFKLCWTYFLRENIHKHKKKESQLFKQLFYPFWCLKSVRNRTCSHRLKVNSRGDLWYIEGCVNRNVAYKTVTSRPL